MVANQDRGWRFDVGQEIAAQIAASQIMQYIEQKRKVHISCGFLGENLPPEMPPFLPTELRIMGLLI
jgi:hypothetical protein